MTFCHSDIWQGGSVFWTYWHSELFNMWSQYCMCVPTPSSIESPQSQALFTVSGKKDADLLIFWKSSIFEQLGSRQCRSERRHCRQGRTNPVHGHVRWWTIWLQRVEWWGWVRAGGEGEIITSDLQRTGQPQLTVGQPGWEAHRLSACYCLF